MKTHIKVKLTEIHSLDWNKTAKRLVFKQVVNDYDTIFLVNNETCNDVKILVTDPDIAKEYKLGECYYLEDFITSDAKSDTGLED